MTELIFLSFHTLSTRIFVKLAVASDCIKKAPNSFVLFFMTKRCFKNVSAFNLIKSNNVI